MPSWFPIRFRWVGFAKGRSIDRSWLASELTRREGGRESMNVAQMSEALKLFRIWVIAENKVNPKGIEDFFRSGE